MPDVRAHSVRLLLSASELGSMLGVARCTVWTWHAGGKIPRPVKIGGTTRWRRDEVEAWLKAGAPPRERWMQIREANDGSH